MFTKSRLFVLLAILVSLLGAGSVVMASGALIAIGPSNSANAVGASDMLMAAHLTVPPPSVIYVEYSQDRLEVPDDRSVAMLGTEAVKSYESVSAFYSDLSNIPTDSESEIHWTILSSIKYASAKGNVLVTTTEPSVAATTKSLFLGKREVKLANGVTAWASEYTNAEFPNRVIFIDGDLLITVASSLPIEDVQKLAADVVVTRP